MMRTLKLALLMTVVGLAVACGSTTTTGPSIPLSSDDAAITDLATANGLGPGPCKNVRAVVLSLRPHPHEGIAEIQVTYIVPGWKPCLVPPVWEASRKGLLVYDKDPFRAEIDWHPDSPNTKVMATAPNGERGHITF